MAPVSLKIVLDNGAVTRKVKFDTTTKVDEAHDIVKDKIHAPSDGKDYGLFLRSADDELSGVWLENDRTLDYYMLRDGDSLDYLCRMRNLRVRMLDGTVKTLQVDESKPVESLMFTICSKIGISNHDEYGLCQDEDEEVEESKDKHQAGTGTLTLTRKTPQKEKDVVLEQLIKKHKTDDDVQWLDQYRTLREIGVDPKTTLLLKRRLYYSDRNVDSRDPVQLNLLYVQIRDVILNGRHPVTEEQAADCKIRWINIRDVHRRMLRKRLNTASKYIRPYKYETELTFMRAFYKDVVSPPEDCEDDETAYEQSWVEENVASNDSDDIDEKPVKKRPKSRKTTKKRKEMKIEEEQKMSTSTYNETVVQPELDSSDPVDAFLISIGATLKTFSPYHLNVAKSKIFAVVQEHDLEQIVQKRPADVSADVKVSPSDCQTIQFISIQ